MYDNTYMEEGGQPKTYDLRLLLRLAKYLGPFKLVLFFTVALILAATAAELALPYITKTAIDRYIVVSAQKADPSRLEPALARRLAPLLTPCGEEGTYFLSNQAATRLDPQDQARLKAKGALSQKRYYLFDPNRPSLAEFLTRRQGQVETYPRLAAISLDALRSLPRGEVMLIRGADLAGLGLLSLLAAGLLFIGFAASFAQAYLLEYAGQGLTLALRQDLVSHLLRQTASYHDQSPTGRLVTRATNDIQNLSELIRSVAVTFFKDLFVLAGIGVILIQLDLRLSLISFLLLPPVLLASLGFRLAARSAFRAIRRLAARINADFQETFAGIRLVQAFNQQKRFRAAFARLNQENYQAGMRQVWAFGLFMPAIDMIAFTALAVVVYYGGGSVLREAVTLGVLVAFIEYVQRFFRPIRDLTEKLNILQSALASLERIFGLFDDKHRLPTASDPITPSRKGPVAVHFEDVHFHYQPGEPVLRGVSFTLEPGQTLAVVGATGAGKTSLINLMLRFYDVTEGRILIDGLDIRELNIQAHRARVGLVMQDVFLFDATVRENLAFGQGQVSQARLAEAAGALGLDRFIQNLPHGWDEPLGTGGHALSTGQRQLMSFARALILNPSLLILDEATSSVDSETEALIETAMGRLTQNRSSIIIAHRLSTIRRADNILVLHEGRVAEFGPHEKLMSERGLYHGLIKLQFSHQPRK